MSASSGSGAALGAAVAAAVLNRLAHGPAPGETAALRADGLDAYLRAQLQAAATVEPEALRARLAELTLLQQSPAELYRRYAQPFRGAALPARLKLRPQVNRFMLELYTARLLRATQSPQQLREVMTDFWLNHFNVYAHKNDVGVWLPDYERQVRTHALGRFQDLLLLTAHHPAMLRYLDNVRSQAPGSGRRPGSGLNENYAREVMELHTLGVDGGYTQQDVTVLARILTGWTIDYPGLEKGGEQVFRFNARVHERGEKWLLGRRFPDDGEGQGVAALTMLAAHSSTARHVCGKLARFFVMDEPPAALVADMARVFEASGGDIAAVLAALFRHASFAAALQQPALFKTPFQYAVSLVRATGQELRNPRPVLVFLQQSGQPLYGWLTPDGYDYARKTWLQPEGMIKRVELAERVASAPHFLSGESPTVEQLRATLEGLVSARTDKAVAAAEPSLRVGLLLAGPDMMRR